MIHPPRLAQRFAARVDDRVLPFLWPLREAIEVFRLDDGSRWQRLACGHAMLLDNNYRPPFPPARRCRPCGAAARHRSDPLIRPAPALPGRGGVSADLLGGEARKERLA